jgi:hypothetical protein
MKKLLPLVFFSLFFFSQCKVVKYTPDKLPTQQIIFGEGGGFSGVETAYTLLENGQIFKQVGEERAYQELRPIKAKTAKSIFEKVNSLQLYKMDIERPGNLYYFLQEVNEAIDSRVVWGSGSYVPPPSVIVVYKELLEVVNKQEVVKEGQKAAGEKEGEEDVRPADEKW